MYSVNFLEIRFFRASTVCENTGLRGATKVASWGKEGSTGMLSDVGYGVRRHA